LAQAFTLQAVGAFVYAEGMEDFVNEDITFHRAARQENRMLTPINDLRLSLSAMFSRSPVIFDRGVFTFPITDVPLNALVLE
jgi:hypothetical protein